MLSPALWAQDERPALERWIELRDGSRIRAAVLAPARLLLTDPRGAAREVSLAALTRLTVARERPGEALRGLEARISMLGSRRFAERERATAWLAAHGAPFFGELQRRLPHVRKLEVKVRLERVIQHLAARGATAAASARAGFDLVADGDGQRAVDAGELTLSLRWRGRALTLGRERLAAVMRELPAARQAPVAAAAGPPVAIRRDDHPRFGGSPRRITFDRDAAGRPLRVGQNVANAWRRHGVVLSTSIKTSFVSVNNYTVGSRSRGMSCATHQPLFNGVLTIRFVSPDDPSRSAGVRAVGFWVAHVSPRGTRIEAYDARGVELGRTYTDATGSDFIGIASERPIAEVRVVPDPRIDRDYTIDDLTFTRPDAGRDLAVTGRSTLLLASGERLRCRQLSADAQRWRALTALGEAPFELPRAAVVGWLGPRQQEPPARLDVDGGWAWALLRSGAQLKVHAREGRLYSPLLGRALELSELSALWGSERQWLPGRSELRWGKGLPLAWLRGDDKDVGFVAARVEGTRLQLTTDRDQLQLLGLPELPPLHFAPRPAKVKSAVQLHDGQRLISASPLRIEPRGVALTVDGRALSVRFARVRGWHAER